VSTSSRCLGAALAAAISCTVSIAGAAPTPKLKGFADLHVHQMAEYGLGGAFFHGSHVGPQKTALAPCTGFDHGYLAGEGELLGLHPKQTDGFPNFKSWPLWSTESHQQVHEDWLKQAWREGLRVMVVSAVNFEPICKAMPHRKYDCDDMHAVDRQIEAARRFEATHDWYRIALTPADARRIIGEGKLAVVLAIEVSGLFAKGDVRAELDKYFKLGVRSIQPVHELNNRFSGAAVFNDIFKKIQKAEHPLHGSSATNGFDVDANGENKMGLTDDGKLLVAEMMKRHMLVDVHHMSRRAVRETYKIAEANHYYPLFISHGALYDVRPKDSRDELAHPASIIQLVKRTGGMLGLRAGALSWLTYSKSGVENSCDASSRGFAQAYQFAKLGLKIPVALASDFHGFTSQMTPRFGEGACPRDSGDARTRAIHAQGSRDKNGVGTEFDTKGLAHIGLLGSVLADLRKLGVDTDVIDNSAESFVEMWERVYDEHRTAMPDAVDATGIVEPPPSPQAGPPPSEMDKIRGAINSSIATGKTLESVGESALDLAKEKLEKKLRH
jgi:microsomal dipeptidase-like Zn-dependent dipeptidase